MGDTRRDFRIACILIIQRLHSQYSFSDRVPTTVYEVSMSTCVLICCFIIIGRAYVKGLYYTLPIDSIDGMAVDARLVIESYYAYTNES